MSNQSEKDAKQAQDEDVANLVKRAQRGDRTAFDDLVRHFQRPVFTMAYRMTGDTDDAADLTQDVFVKLYRSIGSFEGRSKFSTWLFTLTANVCRSGRRRLIRHADREKAILDRDSTDESPRPYEAVDPADGPVEQLEGREALARIQDLIMELPEDGREVVILRDVRDLTYEEIAEALDCSMGTVKSRLARARNRLKDKLIRAGLRCSVKPQN